MPPPYNAHFSDKFSSKLGNINQDSRVKMVVEKILLNPKRNAPFLKGDKFKGKRHTWSGNGNRIVFAVCEECRQLKHQQYNKCSDCKNKNNNSIVFFDYIRGHDYN